MKIGIVGAGIGGLSAAIALRYAGHTIEIFEQAEKIAPMGAALSVWPNALAALDEIGVGDALREVAQPLDNVAVADWQGRDITRFRVSEIIAGQSAFLPTRSELQQCLLDAIGDTPLYLGKKLAGHSDKGSGVALNFADGEQREFDLLVAADGIWSPVATALGQDAPEYAGYGGYLALSGPVSGHPTSASGTEYWGNGERIGIFDLKGNRKYWFYMKSRLRGDGLTALTLEDIRGSLAGWPDEIGAALAATDPEALIPFAVHAKPQPKILARGRVILLGDAAHAMEPNMGQGACQAIEDAVILGRLARSHDAVELAEAYRGARLKRVRKFVNMSRQGSIAPHRLPSALIRPTHAVMRRIFGAFASGQIRKLYHFPQSEK